MAIVELSAPKTILSLWLILFYLFFMLQISFAADGLNRLGYSCDSTFGNNTASAVYGLNRGRLFTQKLYAYGANSIYSNSSDGENPDKVYGLYLCRGDVTKPTCQSCINEAIGYAISEKVCENTKSAITWYAECTVRYSDKPFSFTFESEPALIMSNDHNLNVSDPVGFQKTLNQSFSQLIGDAISSELKYATDIVNISSSVTLYTMGQCIPDLSKEDCRDCLNSAAQLVEYEKNGSRYLYPSCGARFELYQFWNSPAAQEPISPVEAPPPVSDIIGGADLGRNRKENRAWIPITISLLAVVVVVLLGSLIWQIRRRNKRHKEEESNSQEVKLLRLREGRIGNGYSYDTLQGEKQMESQEFPLFPLDLTLEATQHFSDKNKLGEGGFGPVYKGILMDGKEIAVKRLSKTSGQGLQEFKNEVTLIAKLQHKNLVRLLGCCLEGNEMLLIYEFMSNKSLDFILFDSSISIQLDWKKRSSIINGIARGLLYLHEDSRLKIIHRDLKASNVLLDHELNPKISDFGMARIFGEKQSEANTIKVVGTYGYMAPEYAMEGLYSVKSDVFSFGVLLLEIISGRKNSGFYLSEHGLSLLHYTWKLWCEEQAPELMDPVLVQSCIQVELLKYIHIGLLCVQEDQSDRPSMSSVVAMLVTDNIRLPQPTQPAFSVGRAARQGQSLSDVNLFSNEATRSQGQSSSEASDFSTKAARRVRFSSDVV